MTKLLTLLILCAPLWAQSTRSPSGAARQVSTVAALPASCSVGEVRYRTGAGAGLYVATSGTPCVWTGPYLAPDGSGNFAIGTRVPTLYTIGAGAGQLPAAAAGNLGWVRTVSDAANYSDCTLGGGTTVHECYSTGAAWVAFAGSAAGSGTVTNTLPLAANKLVIGDDGANGVKTTDGITTGWELAAGTDGGTDTGASGFKANPGDNASKPGYFWALASGGWDAYLYACGGVDGHACLSAAKPGAASTDFIQTAQNTYCEDAGASDTYACNMTPALQAGHLAAGLRVRFKANTANTGAATFNPNSLGAATIKKNHDQDLADNDIEVGQIVELVYDGTNWQMQSQAAGASATVVHGVGASFGDGVSTLSTGGTTYRRVPYACTITAWSITVDAGTATVDVWKVANGTAAPAVGDSIANLSIAANTHVLDSTPAGEFSALAVTENDIFGFQLKTVATAKAVSVDITCQ